MYYIVATSKSVADAAQALEKAVQAHSFGVLHVYDLRQTLTQKGFPLEAECRIYEVCNPKQAAKVLGRDMRLNAALPCRISVFEDRGKTMIGTIKPSAMLGLLSADAQLGEVAAEVEAAIEAIIDDAAGARWGAARRTLTARRAVLSGEVHAGVAKRAADQAGLRGDNVQDSGELAAADVVLDVDRAEIDRDMTEIAAIDAALARIYGACIDCGATIEAGRLTAAPEASRCMHCQGKAEKRRGVPVARL
jgi:uncharacterized protein (DUF302 family)/RNA polymerase-binding transcription factor DksA